MPKSIVIKKNGGPEVLELQDVKVGTPGPDEIKVTNYAIGLNYIDTYHRSGLYPLKLPSGIGLEAAGQVEEVGSNGPEALPKLIIMPLILRHANDPWKVFFPTPSNTAGTPSLLVISITFFEKSSFV